MFLLKSANRGQAIADTELLDSAPRIHTARGIRGIRSGRAGAGGTGSDAIEEILRRALELPNHVEPVLGQIHFRAVTIPSRCSRSVKADLSAY